MKGKIGLEEHFAIDDTLMDSKGFFPDETWIEVRDRIMDIHGRRLRLMDEFGMEMMVLSLNAPAIQAIHDPKKANEIARKANDYLAEQVRKRPDRFQALAALPLQDPDMAAREMERCVKDLGMVGALANGFSQIGDPNTTAYLDEKQYWPFWDVVREARRAVLSASAQSAAAGLAHLQRRRMAARPDLGVRPRDRGACAAPDGLGPVRQASEPADHPRPHGRRPAVQHLARRQRQRLDSEPQQLSGEEKDRRVFPEQLPHHRVGQLLHPGAARPR